MTMSLSLYVADASAMCQIAEKSQAACCFDNIELTNAVVLLMMPLASHDQKSHVEPCFNHLDLINKLMPLTMPSLVCDANTGAFSMT